jgi:hypothetical protein
MSNPLSSPQPGHPSRFNLEVYVTQTAQLLGLSIPPDQLDGVAKG